MEQTAMVGSIPRTDAEYEAAVDQYLAEMKRMVADIAATRQQIERDRSETEATLARLEARI